MKKLNLKHPLLFYVALAAFSLTDCSKEKAPQAALPNDQIITASAQNMASAVGSDALDSLTVSTFYKGFGPPPFRICSSANQTLFVTTQRESSVSSIIKITPAGVASTFATGFEEAIGIKAAANGDVYVADFWGNKNLIIKVDPSGNKSTLMAPDGTSLASRVFAPQDLAIADDNALYIANTGGNTVLRINGEKLFDVVGKLGATEYVDGTGSAARLDYPTSIKFAKDGNLYLVDDSLGFQDTYVNVTGSNGAGYFGTGGRSIRKLNIAQRKLTTIYRATGNRRIMDIAVAKKDKNFKTTNIEGLFAVFSDNTISFISTVGVETPLTTSTAQGLVNGKLRTAKFGFLTGISIHENFMDIVDEGNKAIRRIIRK